MRVTNCKVYANSQENQTAEFWVNQTNSKF